jgi:hypothetical protein
VRAGVPLNSTKLFGFPKALNIGLVRTGQKRRIRLLSPTELPPLKNSFGSVAINFDLKGDGIIDSISTRGVK